MVAPDDSSSDAKQVRIGRRGLIGGAAAAVAATLASRVQPAEAASGMPLILGTANDAGGPTTLLDTGLGPALGLAATYSPALEATAPADVTTPVAIGVIGSSDRHLLTPPGVVSATAVVAGIETSAGPFTPLTIGVLGTGGSGGILDLGPAVAGVAGSAAPRGDASSTVGVLGVLGPIDMPISPTITAAVAGLHDTAYSGTVGVLGASGPVVMSLDAVPSSGVVGLANADLSLPGQLGVAGVLGDPSAVPGSLTMTAAIAGLSGGTHVGVIGGSADGVGVRGLSFGAQPAIEAIGPLALDVRGTARFNRSGVVSISWPNKTATVAVPGGLTASSIGFAQLQTDLASRYVRAAVPNPLTGQLTVFLNKAPGSATNPKTVAAAWFVVG